MIHSKTRKALASHRTSAVAPLFAIVHRNLLKIDSPIEVCLATVASTNVLRWEKQTDRDQMFDLKEGLQRDVALRPTYVHKRFSANFA